MRQYRRRGMTLTELAEYIVDQCISVPNGCMIWPHGTSSGYPATRLNKKERGHRLVWMAENGPVPDGCDVMHSCDDRRCCRYEHLSVGTRAQNVRDMVAKGRTTSHLTWTQVREIRARYDVGNVTQKQLAAEYGCSQPTISDITRNHHWDEEEE